jgi:hypothetical protein
MTVTFSNSRTTARLGGLAAGVLTMILLTSATASAQRGGLYFEGGRVHPACIHALTMQEGDTISVLTAISLPGCAASERTRSEVKFEGEVVYFEDDAILGGGSFGYRELTRLENGMYAIGIRRILADGTKHFSVAAVEIVARPMLRSGMVVRPEMLELVGEARVEISGMASLETAGNVVSFKSGLGPKAVSRTVDFSRVGAERRKRR